MKIPSSRKSQHKRKRRSWPKRFSIIWRAAANWKIFLARPLTRQRRKWGTPSRTAGGRTRLRLLRTRKEICRRAATLRLKIQRRRQTTKVSRKENHVTRLKKSISDENFRTISTRDTRPRSSNTKRTRRPLNNF